MLLLVAKDSFGNYSACFERVNAFEPTIAAFHEFKSYLANVIALPDKDSEIIEVGFRRLAISRMFYSGHGSGPRGGRSQLSGRIDERWSAGRPVEKVRFHHRRLRRSGKPRHRRRPSRQY